ncbi:MAG: hypothetical protein E5Y55_24150 [Mesorhizobium sp.]|uniref:hypothetical protein n=1 Tax=Mesorhizobium sp. TaxID=1871066 RepID=UPI00120C909D|nr:hypothetical protein [Mesorhizobium sp.]TIM41774.1 MAG: hypothetical protein E5Y55_24150 [Mesorhizobium sp.]
MTPEIENMGAAPRIDETWNYRIPESLADLIPLFENRVACHRLWAKWLGQETDETRRYGEHGLGHAKNHQDYVKQYSAAKQLVEEHERATAVAVTDAMVHAYKHAFSEYLYKSALGHITPPTPDVGFHATKYALGVALAPATQAGPGDMVVKGWTYSINYGPDGEENWANLTTPNGEHVGNIRTHHAQAIVRGMNAPLAPATQAGPGDMVEALRFYANEKNWTAGRWPQDLDELVEGLICIDWQHEEGGSIPFADCGDRARAAIAAAPAVQALPDMVEVPREPTEAMPNAVSGMSVSGPYLGSNEARDIWDVMLAAPR